MEKEELDLINRLKNTKLIEEQAHQQLESAIKDPLQNTIQQSVNQKRASASKATAKGTRM